MVVEGCQFQKISYISNSKATSWAERLNKWQDYFQDLLSNTSNASDNEIEYRIHHNIIDSPLNVKLGNITPDELNEGQKK